MDINPRNRGWFRDALKGKRVICLKKAEDEKSLK